MEVYRCDLTLHDYLFFATTERGKVAETGPFIHNYALTYALGWAISPWYNDVQKPHYREELAKVGQRYVTPAKLLRGSYIISQYNTMSESYNFTKARSVGYPDWGFIKCFRPGATFRCYIVSAEVVQFPHYLRLGKFMAKTALHITPARQLQRREVSFKARDMQQKQLAHPMLNWQDLPKAAHPVVYDIIVNALPSHLIENPIFDEVAGSYLLASFDENEPSVQIPLHMGYYGENLCVSW